MKKPQYQTPQIPSTLGLFESPGSEVYKKRWASSRFLTIRIVIAKYMAATVVNFTKFSQSQGKFNKFIKVQEKKPQYQTPQNASSLSLLESPASEVYKKRWASSRFLTIRRYIQQYVQKTLDFTGVLGRIFPNFDRKSRWQADANHFLIWPPAGLRPHIKKLTHKRSNLVRFQEFAIFRSKTAFLNTADGIRH